MTRPILPIIRNVPSPVETSSDTGTASAVNRQSAANPAMDEQAAAARLRQRRFVGRIYSSATKNLTAFLRQCCIPCMPRRQDSGSRVGNVESADEILEVLRARLARPPSSRSGSSARSAGSADTIASRQPSAAPSITLNDPLQHDEANESRPASASVDSAPRTVGQWVRVLKEKFGEELTCKYLQDKQIGDDDAEARPELVAESRRILQVLDRFFNRKAALQRGIELRKKICISTPMPGVVLVSLKNVDAAFLENHLGMKNMAASEFPKTLHYVSVSLDHYVPYVAAGYETHEYDSEDDEGNPVSKKKEEMVNTANLEPSDIVSMMAPHLSGEAQKKAAFIYQSGSYFGIGARQTVGETVALAGAGAIGRTGDGSVQGRPFIKPKEEYEDDYHRLEFATGNTLLCCAPLLSLEGEPQFDEEKAKQRKYQFTFNYVRPGTLVHCEHPNPRAGIAVPKAPGIVLKGPGIPPPESAEGVIEPLAREAGPAHSDRIRMAVGSPLTAGGTRGAQSAGYTMVEWSEVMARLDRLNEHPGGALNLDGGGSITLTGVSLDAPGNQIAFKFGKGMTCNYIVLLKKEQGAPAAS